MDSDSRTKTYTNKNIEQKKLQKQQKKLNPYPDERQQENLPH